MIVIVFICGFVCWGLIMIGNFWVDLICGFGCIFFLIVLFGVVVLFVGGVI